jgi:hypothetical protein
MYSDQLVVVPAYIYRYKQQNSEVADTHLGVQLDIHQRSTEIHFTQHKHEAS